MKCRQFFLRSILLLSAFGFRQATAQTIPMQVTNYDYQEYKGGIQNWGIAVAGQKALYCGNSNGLLRYNGNDWILLEPGERATVRAVCCVGDTVYTAGDNNIGYWTQAADGKITYTSLLPLVNALGISGDTFWTIGAAGGQVYFHSFANIIRYDGKRMDYVVKNECYVSLFQTGGRLFTQKNGGALQQIAGDTLTVFFDTPVFQNEEIKYMFRLSDEKYLLGLADGRIYTAENGKIALLKRLKTENHTPVRVDCGSLHNDEWLAVGTIGDGLFLLDLKNGRQIRLRSPRLHDQNIHGLCFAGNDCIWLSSDNGISSVRLDPETYLLQNAAETGAFFDAACFEGNTYIATNQGLFFYGKEAQKRLPGLYPLQFCYLKNELLCGTTTRLYKLRKHGAQFEPFCDINGVRQFEYMADRGEEYLFLRSYSGISLLCYEKNTWRYFSSLLHTEDYAYILPENLHTVWAVHPEKGLFRLRVDPTLTQVEGFDNFTDIEGYSNYNRISLFKVEDKIRFATPKGVYSFDMDGKKFRRQETLSREIRYLDRLQSVKPAYGNTIWAITGDELYLYRVADGSAELLLHQPFAANRLMLYDKHFNLRSTGDSLTFVSTCAGTVVMHNNRMEQRFRDTAPLRIESVCFTDGKALSYADFHRLPIALPNTATRIVLKVTNGLHASLPAISYRMPGISDEWSEWQTSGCIRFTNLPAGSYRLEIKDSNRNRVVVPIRVSPPFYKRTWMGVFYVSAFLSLTAAMFARIGKRKQRRWLMQMEAEQKRHAEELQRAAYEQLQEKVKNQENELKSKMRFLTRKQELLDAISTEVEKQKRELGDRYPNRFYNRLVAIIQNGATEKDKLLSFENYFVEVHYDFMLQMQKAYPALSPSELKFCCLLRSNLSTKEIAAVMGIALRSVELKKYRLKRKLNLAPGSSLAACIFSV